MQPSLLTVHEYLSRLAAARPERPLFLDEEESVSAREALDRTDALAGWLYAEGISRGTLVAVRTTRAAGTALLLFALWAVGAVAALSDPREDAEACARELDAAGVLAEADGAWRWTPIGGASVPVQPEGNRPYPLAEDAKAPAMLIFTSGTTGKRKAVLLSQYNAVNDLVDAEEFGDYRPDDLALGVLPFTHIFGIVLLLGTVILGYGLFLPRSLDAEHLLRCVECWRLTRMNGVPSLYAAMARKAEGYDLSTLRVGFIGGAPSTQEQFDLIERSLGMTLLNAYGMSECVSITLSAVTDSPEERCRTAGHRCSMSRLRLLLPDGTEAPAGTEGEVCVDAPTRFLGYYRDPEATAEVVDRDGFVHTGDLGVLEPNGLLRLTGRSKEILIRNGNNLSLRAIEEQALSVPGVEQAVVVPLTDAREGEVPGLLAVASIPEAALHAALAERLPRNALPALIRLTDTIPAVHSGKPDKQRIRKELEQWRTV